MADRWLNEYVEIELNKPRPKSILDKTERAKCDWLLKNNIFSRILIAQKGTKR